MRRVRLRVLLRVLLLLRLLLLLGPVPGRGAGCQEDPVSPNVGVTQPCTRNETLELTAGEPVTGDPSPVTPQFVSPSPEATGKDIIPVYCSLLAAVVVGLLAYVAFKCWHTCRQKKQLAKARAGDMGTSPEGEKLHGDSGVFLDTHSLQEPHQPSKGLRDATTMM